MSEGFPIKDTQYGFMWGSGEIVRIFDDSRFGVVFEIRGKRQAVDVRVTSSGLIRIGDLRRRKAQNDRKSQDITDRFGRKGR